MIYLVRSGTAESDLKSLGSLSTEVKVAVDFFESFKNRDEGLLDQSIH